MKLAGRIVGPRFSQVSSPGERPKASSNSDEGRHTFKSHLAIPVGMTASSAV